MLREEAYQQKENEMSHSKIYNEAAALIEHGWTQGAIARTIGGAECKPSSKLAESWCINGALQVASIARAWSKLCKRP